MTPGDLTIGINTVWVVIAAVLVMFMQAGFAFLEAGMTRMKNAGHVAAKNVLTFALCSLVYWAIGFGIAFGDGNALIGTSGFAPDASALLSVGKAPFSFFGGIPGGAGYLFEVVFAGVSVAIVWGGMAERAKLWVYFAFGAAFTIIYSVVSHWVWQSNGWLFGLGMQDFAGSTVVHYQGALAALAGALLLGPRIGRFGPNGQSNAIAGHNLPYAVLGTIILWFGWFGFNPGSTLGIVSGDRIGFFAYVATTTNLAAAAGGLSGIMVSWAFVHRKPDLSMLLIGAVAAAVAVWGIGFVERLGIDDPIGAVAVHGMAGIWGTLATGLFAAPSLAATLATGRGGLLYTGDPHQLGVQTLGLVSVGLFTFTASFAVLWAMNRLWGIRVEERSEVDGLDLAEHGTWGYPEFAGAAVVAVADARRAATVPVEPSPQAA